MITLHPNYKKVDITTTRTDAIPQGFVLGVDFGSMRDRTALIVNEWALQAEKTWSQGYMQIEPELVRSDNVISHSFRAMHRPKTGVAYPAIVEQIKIWLADLPTTPRPPAVVIDATGLGGPISHYLTKENVRHIALVITAGGEVKLTSTTASVPKSHLAGTMQVALQTGRLKISSELPEAAAMLREMQSFKVKLTSAGHEVFESGANAVHDDLVTSGMLAIWLAEKRKIPLTAEELDRIGRQIRDKMFR